MSYKVHGHFFSYHGRRASYIQDLHGHEMMVSRLNRCETLRRQRAYSQMTSVSIIG